MSEQKSQAQRANLRRGVAQLGARLDKNLVAYAIAGAAGIGMMTTAAEAEVVYTPANIPITVNGDWVPLDLNADGVIDFYFNNVYAGPFVGNLGGHASYMSVFPASWPSPNGIGGVEVRNCPEAVALPAGAVVNSKRPFLPGGIIFDEGGSYGSKGFGCGLWRRTHDGFLGFKFQISGEIHYGWAHLNTNGVPTILGYAYQTIANGPLKTFTTPDKDVVMGSLGALARGKAGK